MKRGTVLFAGALVALSMVGPAFAQGIPAAKTETPVPAEKPAIHKAAATRRLTGEVVSVNQEAKTLIVKRGSKGQELTVAVEGKAGTHLGDLKAGDQVRISYIKSHHQLVAKDIVKSTVAKAK